MRRVAVYLAFACLALAVGPGSARAEFEPIELVSATAAEQADFASEPALSADGRYVVFRGQIGGLSGIFRRDLGGGGIEPVIVGDPYPDAASADAVGADARAPSISADGRFVSFTTKGAVDPSLDGDALDDVYVRDMDAAATPGACAAGVPCPYALASIAEGGTAAVAGGAVAAGGQSLSGDGTKVVFVTLGESDLTSGPEGTTPGAPTPPLQVAVRDLAAGRTMLVSAKLDPLTGTMTRSPVTGGAVPPPTGIRSPAASISGDGTTVAWDGFNIPTQAPTLGDEREAMDRGVNRDGYDEPLWRRIADGPAAPTRRIVGGGDPLAPGCPPDGTMADAACRGPLPELTVEIGAFSLPGGFQPFGGPPPRLSQNGLEVAVAGAPGFTNDAFLVDMSPGLDRVQAVRQLTREGRPATRRGLGDPALGDVGANAAVEGLTVSPDGSRLALTTARQQFPLAPPNLIGGPLVGIGLVELYWIDLDAGTIQRLTPGPGSSPSIGSGESARSPGGAGAAAPGIAADDTTLAFADQATNIVDGDANEASDVFLARLRPPPPKSRGSAISGRPAPLGFAPRWQISVRAHPRADGSVSLAVVVPGAGAVRARVAAAVPGRHGTLPQRQIATAKRRPSQAGTAILRLRPRRRYRRLTKIDGGLTATLAVAFTAPGHPPLRKRIQVSFALRRRPAHPKRGGR